MPGRKYGELDEPDGVRAVEMESPPSRKPGCWKSLGKHQRNLVISSVVAFVVVGVVAAVAMAVRTRAPQPYKPWLRPIAHVLPRSNWCNDPNAPMYYGGKYHLFMQYNPDAAKWGNIHWYHVTSDDMVFWEDQPIALAPDRSYDAGGVWSGSATVVDGVPVLSYTCVNEAQLELQCQAHPKDKQDPVLREWVKDASNPVVPTLPGDTPGDLFRDPTTAWKVNDTWWMGVGAANTTGHVRGGGIMVLYSTKDWTVWRERHAIRPGHSPDYMLECPDLYTLGSSKLSHRVSVFKYSSMDDRRDWYQVGDFDRHLGSFTPSAGVKPRLVDPGVYYASKSFEDLQPGAVRQVLWGWADETDSQEEAMRRGWAGVQAFPRVVEVDPVVPSQLRFPPLPELISLREKEILRRDVKLHSDRTTQLADGRNQELVATLPVPTGSTAGCFRVGVLASIDLAHYTGVSICRNGTDSAGTNLQRWTLTVSTANSGGSTPASEFMQEYAIDPSKDSSVDLFVFVDGSIVEAYAQSGRAVVTARAYPELGQDSTFLRPSSIGGTASLYSFALQPAFRKRK